MLRLIGFFILVLVALTFLRQLPLVGALFRIPLLGFYLAAVVVAVAGSRLAARALDRRKQRALERQLGSVDTPHNKGKLGQLLLAQGRFREAVPLFVEAVRAEPESADWHYRLGRAHLGAGEDAQAIAELEACIAIEQEHAYGTAMLRLAEALSRAGRHEEARAALERFERNHGPSPESAYRRGLALRGLGQAEAARRAFEQVGQLSSQLAKFHRKAATGWVMRAWMARLSAR